MTVLNSISILTLMKIIPILLALFILNHFLQYTVVRRKFMLFLVIFMLFIILGLCFNLDGIVLLFILSEFVVLLIFVIVFSQLTSFSTKTPKQKSYLYVLFLGLLFFATYDINILSYKAFYSQQTHQLNDFFYFFNFFFEKQSTLTIIIIMLITTYSFFFILLYFTLKSIKTIETQKNSKIFTLRKQNIIKQSDFSIKTRFFKK